MLKTKKLATIISLGSVFFCLIFLGIFTPPANSGPIETQEQIRLRTQKIQALLPQCQAVESKVPVRQCKKAASLRRFA